ncbi:MAG: hypothetical protein GF331_16810 [Chitinivibrionales bacterium]|nr:hypothetical protein [Chitinivibrionales bacterium]
MRPSLHAVVALLLTAGLPCSSQPTHMTVMMRSGAASSVSIDDIRRMTFEAGALQVQTFGGTSPFVVNDIRSIKFGQAAVTTSAPARTTIGGYSLRQHRRRLHLVGSPTGRINVAVSRIDGRTVFERDLGFGDNGTASVLLRDLARGSYVVRIRVDGHRVGHHLITLH